jgi:hypothetical protein
LVKGPEKQAFIKNGTLIDNQPVLTMSSVGQLGRFGNQLFQYASLKICTQNQSGLAA